MSRIGPFAAAALTAAAALLVVASASARDAVPRTQQVSILIRAGDRVAEPNFAFAAGVPVRITVTNYTREFHTFTIPALKVRALIAPATAGVARTTTVSFTPDAVGTFAWHCLICPSGEHGIKHAMGGMLYLIVDPSVLG
ncbi:MAG: hypothetical protein ACXVZL_05245 [Gaiellaceae bacterium]